MRLTVLGGSGAWPVADRACSGYLVEHEGFRLLLDPGYATFPRLLARAACDQVDAVYVSHGHPDHCADLNPLLRARSLADEPAAPLPVHAPEGALDAVLALDRPGMLDDAYLLHEFAVGSRFEIGPFSVHTFALPHWLPDAGLRLTAGDRVLAYTGDSGPDPALLELARDADLFLAEATYPGRVPAGSSAYLSSARQCGTTAARSGAHRLLLTHLWPGTDPGTALESAAEAAGSGYDGGIEVATADLQVDLLG